MATVYASVSSDMLGSTDEEVLSIGGAVEKKYILSPYAAIDAAASTDDLISSNIRDMSCFVYMTGSTSALYYATTEAVDYLTNLLREVAMDKIHITPPTPSGVSPVRDILIGLENL